ncbi:MAG TPA: hypothetical protein VLM43_07295, partial [Desulfobacterales bacterium]|nr:hypothetical protein [Desulfobacterales bacterium]
MLKNKLMNKRTYPQTYRDEDNERRSFFSNFAISLFCHLVFFVILIFAPGYATDKNPSLSVINVSLVTLPSQNNAPLAAEYKPQTTVEKVDQKVPVSSEKSQRTDKKSQESIS